VIWKCFGAVRIKRRHRLVSFVLLVDFMETEILDLILDYMAQFCFGMIQTYDIRYRVPSVGSYPVIGI
jgi:hypothetical protein